MSIADLPATTSVDVPIQPPFRPLTVSDLEAFPTDLPSGPVDYELDNGRLVIVMAPPGGIHGSVQARISGRLLFLGELKHHGRVFSEAGIVLWRDPDCVSAPDVAFVASKSLPVRLSPEGYLETIPELVVEIRSKNDSLDYVRRKVEHYLKAGVEIVWVVDPATKSVEIHLSGGHVVARGAGESLDVGDLIPGFALAVADVFVD